MGRRRRDESSRDIGADDWLRMIMYIALPHCGSIFAGVLGMNFWGYDYLYHLNMLDI